MIEKHKIISTFIANFVQKNKVERTLFELSNPTKRNKFINRLNHNWEDIFNMRLLAKVEKENDSYSKIQHQLGIKSEELCYIISNYDGYDDFVLPFKDVFDHIYTRGLASIIINISASTFYFEAEQIQGNGAKFIGRKA